MALTLTYRGALLLGVTAGCLALAAIFGARSLNAVVAPAVVALGAALVIVWRAPAPSIERTLPPDGHPGETHPVRLDVADCGPGNYRLRDQVGDGLATPGETYDVTDGTATISYELQYLRRGDYRLDPPTASVTDGLGLVERTLSVPEEPGQLLVYPAVVDPPPAVRSLLESVVALDHRPGRDEFDALREYVRGDSLRDVHWKSSARRPGDDLVVKEFDDRSPTDAVRIAVAPTGNRDAVDAAARAAASVATMLIREGVEVGLETPTSTLAPAVGAAHRTAILATLAQLRAGQCDAADATVRITTSRGEAKVHANGRSVPFAPDAAALRERGGIGRDGANGRRPADAERSAGVTP
jgi:uncharacterized protein (DUF58 family)